MGCPGNGRCDLDPIEALYEREAEERRLNALLDEARAGGSGIAIVDGAVGSGVTSLLDESARSAAHAGITVLRGRGAASLEAASLAPVLTSIGAHLDGMRAVERARLLDGLGGIAEALGGRLETSAPLAETALFESVARLARRLATEHGLLWVIDDVHLADRMTLSLLTYLAARGAPRGVVVLIGQHPSTGPALADLRRAVRSGGGSLLELSPLSDDAAARLARRIRPDLDDEGVAVIVARSNGSPSIVRALAEADSMTPGVARLDALLERALAGADEGARTVFELIAVAGADVPHAALARLDGTPDLDRSCRQLITRGLIERTESPIGTAYRVTAPALAVAVDDALGAGRRQLAHAQLAAALEQVPGVDAEALAPHYRAAAQLLPADRTVEILVEAGTQAHERRAFQAAIPNLEAALAIGALARERVPEVLARLGDAYYLTGRPEDAVRAFRRLIGLVPDDDPSAEEARFVLAWIRSDVEGGRVRVPANPGMPGRAHSTAEQAVLDLFMVDRFAESDRLDAAAGRLRALDVPGASVEQRAAAALGDALGSWADLELARAHCERALALVVDAPHSVVAQAVAAELARLCLALGDIDAADRAGQLAVELVHRGGPIAVEASARCLGALLPMLRGDLPEARRPNAVSRSRDAPPRHGS
ncbi:AAA family ATPase [Agromyces sp. Soil535]|uniref:AAA family ATPase n=1 Tax=Agromyces sp. Soil535 TaxID=1736390 RepID=UPI00138EFF42|nr:AAA family ATPase [Agromyces sp. Soil535]